MALKSTIFKAELSVADIDRGYYRDHALTRSTFSRMAGARRSCGGRARAENWSARIGWP
jgi:hypothetical protein